MDNFEVVKGLPFKMWKIKNHNEMRDYIRQTCPDMCFNNEFVEGLAKIQMEQLTLKKLEILRQRARERQYSA